MNSCLYKAKVMHHRMAPKEHRFHYSIFMFYLDLDEIDMLAGKMRWMSRNKFNLFNFRDKDHLQGPRENPDPSRDLRGHLSDYLLDQGVQVGRGRIMVLTNLCTLGYQFNPVSFYFCYDEAGVPLCSVVEVCNTFREMKPYFLGKDDLEGDRFRQRTGKYFYISPFADHDTDFDFDLRLPTDKLQLRIDDYDQAGQRFFVSTLGGERKPLTDTRLLSYLCRFPLITLQVITLIHWEALRLWIKKLPFHKKAAFPELQRDVYRSKTQSS